MKKTKKPAKNIAVVFGPNQISSKMKQSIINHMKKHRANQVAAAKAKEAEEKALAAKAKGVEVEDLRKAITLGLGFKEASYVGLKAVENLKIMENSSDEAPDLDWMEGLIRHLFEKNDHTLHFKAEEDESDGFVNWTVSLEPWEKGVYFDLPYLVTELDDPESDAQEDAEILNQFILDFYGIEEHKVDPVRRVEEIKGEISNLESELKGGQKRLKELKSNLASLLSRSSKKARAKGK